MTVASCTILSLVIIISALQAYHAGTIFYQHKKEKADEGNLLAGAATSDHPGANRPSMSAGSAADKGSFAPPAAV